jgi:protein TonB
MVRADPPRSDRTGITAGAPSCRPWPGRTAVGLAAAVIVGGQLALLGQALQRAVPAATAGATAEVRLTIVPAARAPDALPQVVPPDRRPLILRQTVPVMFKPRLPAVPAERSPALAQEGPPPEADRPAVRPEADRRAALRAYQERLWAIIVAHRPPRVRAAGQVRIAFSLDRGGGLTAVAVARSSGDPMLDRLAVEAVRRSAPFPPPPSEAGGSADCEIEFHFRGGGP